MSQVVRPLTLCAVLLTSANVDAQSSPTLPPSAPEVPPPPAAPPPEVAPQPTPPSPSYAPPPPPVPVVQPPAPPADDKPLFRFYGFIKPTVIVGNGLESFGNEDYVAVTAAANPVFLNNADSVGLGFQAQQTRLGLAVGENLPVKGVIEFDFVDFAKSSPVQSTGIRVRQAYADWTVKPGHKLVLGQMWDLFSPLNSHTYDIVGNNFQAGNSGFMRHQVVYGMSLGKFEGGLALGLSNQNLTNVLGNVEYGRMPTFALRGGYKDKAAWVGASAIATRIVFDATKATEKFRVAYAGNLFADLTFGMLNLRAEAYAGQNLNNLGALVIGSGSLTADVKEAGAWVSAKATLNERNAAHLVAGGAAILNPSDMALGYTPGVAATGTTAAIAPVRVGANGPGIEHNVVLRAGYSYTPLKGLSLLCEPFLIFTKHKLDAADKAKFDENRKGWGVQAGGLYTF